MVAGSILHLECTLKSAGFGLYNHSGTLQTLIGFLNSSLKGFVGKQGNHRTQKKTGRSCFFFLCEDFFEDAGSVITMSACLPQTFGFWPFKKNMCVTCYQFFWIFEGWGESFKSVPKKPQLEVDDSPLDVVGAESAGSDDCAPEGRHMLPPLYLGFGQEIWDLTKTSVWRLVCLILSCGFKYLDMFYFHPYLGKCSIWVIFFRWVETTN